MTTAHPLPIQSHTFFDSPQPFAKLASADIYDLAIIGGGISGVSAALEASHTTLKSILLERGLETSVATTRANSGIVHCGVHTTQGTLKAQLEQKGRRIFAHLCKSLNVSLRRCGELVIARNEAELNALQELQKSCAALDLECSLWGPARVKLEEPNLAIDSIEGALSIPETSVVNPFELCNAMANCAMANGVEISCGSTVTGIRKINRLAEEDGDALVESAPKVIFELRISRQGSSPVYLYAQTVINATGVDAGSVTELLKNATPINITKRRGELYVLDKNLKDVVTRVIFSVIPNNASSKGMLIIPTVDGTVMVGPTAEPLGSTGSNMADIETTEDGRSTIFAHAHALCPRIVPEEIMYSFASARAVLPSNDFVIRDEDGFIQCAGIQSPGLTAGPAIGAYLIELVKLRYPSHRMSSIVKPPEAWFWYPITSRLCRTALDKRHGLIEKDLNFSKIVCGCECVTEADIENAITEGARSITGLKLRTRATAGRCQGSFCSSKLRKLLAARLGVSYEQVCRISHNTPMDKAYPSSTVDVKLYRPLDCSEVGIRASLVSNLLFGPKHTKESALNAFSLSTKLVQCIHAFDLVVLGTGPAGLGAALAAYDTNPDARILVITKDAYVGGSLLYALHRSHNAGDGSTALTGPEFAVQLREDLMKTGVITILNTFILDSSYNTSRKLFTVKCMSANVGQLEISAKAVIFCLGSREKHRFNAAIPGTRPYGVMTADAALRSIAFDNVLPGKRVVIFGSGDSGLLAARQISISGGQVLGIYEPESHLVGNSQYLDLLTKEFDIPISYNKSISRINGQGVIESVCIAPVNPLTKGVTADEAETVACDCLVTSLGTLPQMALVKGMGCKGVSSQYCGLLVDNRCAVASDKLLYAAGGNLHCHPSAESSFAEGKLAGFNAAIDAGDTARSYNPPSVNLTLSETNRSDIKYFMPQSITLSKRPTDKSGETFIYFKTTRAMANVRVTVSTTSTGKVLATEKFREVSPTVVTRMVVSNSTFQDLVPGVNITLKLEFDPHEFSVKVVDNRLLGVFSTAIPVLNGAKPHVIVKNKTPVPVDRMSSVLKELNATPAIQVEAPVSAGQTVLRNVAGQTDFVACENIPAMK